MNNKRKVQYSLLSLLGIALITELVFWNIARDEIYYLCSNFSEGVEQSSVIMQLDTANLSRYQQSVTENGSRIIFSSIVNFNFYQCIIELDKDKTVLSSVFL
ncbi:MAG: hypothetical protein COC19_07685 [SAR86 cluster bacterium]|uniref:Uncharacterized protein n=1 Tax=SAR86 cluster bacterium TaxID=2030880 RepID=A0A2A4MH37_9GAMM|nr:MAG: hypothetical protein COC19_07685 [SAR86 cluster bacterium]